MAQPFHKADRVVELLNTPRLAFKQKQSNTTHGLYHLISKHVSPKHVIVELGSFAGVSSELFALHCGKLYCVDKWEPYWEINQDEKMLTAEKKFDAMISNYNNIVKVKQDSIEAAKMFDDDSIDLVYIDSDHSSERVKAELNTWLPKVKSTGYIAGHDINMPTVFNVIMRRFDPTMVEFFNDTSWIVKKSSQYDVPPQYFSC
jgi:predicted O-methyltransferase YrrM